VQRLQTQICFGNDNKSESDFIPTAALLLEADTIRRGEFAEQRWLGGDEHDAEHEEEDGEE